MADLNDLVRKFEAAARDCSRSDSQADLAEMQAAYLSAWTALDNAAKALTKTYSDVDADYQTRQLKKLRRSRK